MAYVNDVFIDNIVANQLPGIKKNVLKKDKDKVIVIDGREGAGKSVFAMQLAKALDPDFNLEKIAWNAKEFIALVKSPKRKMGDCILMDEAFSSASSRGALSNVNKAMMGVATEMRQKNLFVIICLPSFFDLDKYFAIWRCDTLFHVYFKKNGDRGRYIIFPFQKKKTLHIKGKKTYNYGCVKSPYPPCTFPNTWVVEEYEYRRLKAKAFSKRSLSTFEKRWQARCAVLIRRLVGTFKETEQCLGDLLGLKREHINMLKTGAFNGEEGQFEGDAPVLKLGKRVNI